MDIGNESFTLTINDNEIIAERKRDYIDYKDCLKHGTRICKSKNTKGDIYNRKIGIAVAILKTLGFSRRIVNKIADILLEEDKRR